MGRTDGCLIHLENFIASSLKGAIQLNIFICPVSVPSKNQRLPNRSPKDRHKMISIELIDKAIKETPTTYNLWLLPLFTLWGGKEVTTYEKTLHIKFRAEWLQKWNWSKTNFKLLTLSIVSEIFLCSYQL